MTSATGMQQWSGCSALVTGASSGIGREVVRRLVSAGIRVAACARRKEKLDELGAELAGAHHSGELSLVRLDLRREDEILAAFEQVRGTWGGVDILVNSAGLGYDSPLLSGDTSHWRETLDVNVLAVAILSREAIQDMIRRGGAGQIVNISSLAGHRLFREGGMYPASKFALRAMTETLRRELRQAGSGIRISCISPGLVATGFAHHYHGDPEKGDAAYAQNPTLRPSDVAEAVEYILSQPPDVDVNDILVRPTMQEA